MLLLRSQKFVINHINLFSCETTELPTILLEGQSEIITFVYVYFLSYYFYYFSFYIAMSFFSFYRVLRVRIHIK